MTAVGNRLRGERDNTASAGHQSAATEDNAKEHPLAATHEPGDPHPGKFSCVVDSPARFHVEVLRWYATLSRVAGVDPSDLIVHAVNGCHSDVLDFLAARGVTVRGVKPFDERSPHCNKISGALDLASCGVEGLAILTDTDVVVLEDPRALAIPFDSVASKPVDRPHPPLSVITNVFASAGLRLPSDWPIDWHPGESTIAGNGNGGFYLIPGELLATVAPAWEHWARWLLTRRDLLTKGKLYVDQVALAMALTAEGVPPHRLDSKWNFPIHRPQQIPGSVASPAIIHYHDRVSAAELLLKTGVDTVDRQIDVANAAITETWHDAFPNVS